MASRELIAALDIGTSKVCAIVAEPRERPRVIGMGCAPCEGLRKGVVSNAERTIAAVVAAVAEAERASGVKIEDAAIGVGGDQIRAENGRAVIAVSRATGEIREQDMKRVVEAGRDVDVPADRTVLHAVTQGFLVDGEQAIRDPLGMTGVRLEGHVHVVTAPTAAVQGLARCARRAGVRARRLVILPYASAFAVLTPEEVDVGVALLDIGAGTTGIAAFADGAVRHTAVLPVGGQHVTNDIAIGLRTPAADAERIKVRYARVCGRGPAGLDEIRVPAAGGEDHVVTPDLLASIVEPRVEEMLALVAAELRDVELLDRFGAGIVLTGGTALLPGIAELAERVFEMPARLGAPEPLDGLSRDAADPRLAAVNGLILYGVGDGRGERGTLVSSVSTRVESARRAVTHVTDWLKDFF
jgi:cell division protein FtsA